MNNQEALVFYKELAEKNYSQNSVKLAKNTDYTKIDADFILKYADLNSLVLDLGSGTGLIVNKMYDKIGRVVCVENFKQFSKFIVQAPNVEIINCNISDYEPTEKFDVITMFGFMHYFNEMEATEIYQKIYNQCLKDKGVIIVKNQFGLKEDVTVSGYSEEQKTNYYSQYRYIHKEVGILKKIGFHDVEIFDIYPPNANRWSNTHFYAIVGKK
ncbi:MAG: class I SAM-dependent methyltransferase [Alphaproteobacteria bacterium]|nr:class I SAM-dependent methyltransferase [Alphaproteobacteria bacterium]